MVNSLQKTSLNITRQIRRQGILLVENNFFNKTHLKSLLEDHRLKVVGIANNYKEAVKTIDMQDPNLILLDVELDGEKTGLDVAEYALERNIPILFFTGNPSKVEEIISANECVKGIIDKPASDAEIVEKIVLTLEEILS